MNEIEHLERIATFYHSAEASDGVNHFHLHLRDIMIPAEGGDSALELGCGSGRWTRVLCERYAEVDTVDAAGPLVEAVVAAYQGVGASLRGHVALVEDFLAAAGRTWQHVYLSMLLEHVADPVDLLARSRRVCAADGSIFIAVPNATSIHRTLAVRAGLICAVDELSENDHRVGHRRVYTPELLARHVRDAGFTITESLPVGLKPITHGQMKALPDAVLWALCRSGDLVPNNPAYLVIKAKP
ncbi:MAG: class I SAM-dependent methyltransferase [Gammaproteobacteria bacterium]|nr:class I SAM-dependent methyltransferase [Gammaproteobacteria bacterium]